MLDLVLMWNPETASIVHSLFLGQGILWDSETGFGAIPERASYKSVFPLELDS